MKPKETNSVVVFDLSTNRKWEFAGYTHPEYALANTNADKEGLLEEFTNLPLLRKIRMLSILPFEEGRISLLLGDCVTRKQEDR